SRNSQHLRRFLDGKTAKEAQLDDSTLLFIVRRKTEEGIIELHQVDVLADRFGNGIIQRDRERTGATFGGTSISDVVHQNPTDQLGSDAEELRAVLPFDAALIHEFQIHLMDECRRLKRVVR